MRIQNGIVTTLHAYSEDDELIPREFIIDMFSSDGYAKHLVVSNGVSGKTIDYHTGAIN